MSNKSYEREASAMSRAYSLKTGENVEIHIFSESSRSLYFEGGL